jgi:hypothetical protein
MKKLFIILSVIFCVQTVKAQILIFLSACVLVLILAKEKSVSESNFLKKQGAKLKILHPVFLYNFYIKIINI